MANFCTQCGAPVGGNKFCTQCGAPVPGASETRPAQADAPAVDAPAYAAAPTQAMPSVETAQAAYEAVAPAVAPAAASAAQPAVQPVAAQATVQPASAQPAKKSGNGAKIGIIAAAGVLAVGAGVALAVLHPWAPDGETEGSSSAPAAAEQSSSEGLAAGNDSQSVSVAGNSSEGQSQQPTSEPQKPASVAAPDLSGMPEDDARKAIEDAGLSVGSVMVENSDDVAKGQVIRQNPAAGENMEAGTSVGLVVSAGKAEHRYEFVSGSYTWEQAKSEASSRGGYLACVTSQEEWDKVVGTIPSSGVFVVWVGASADSSRSWSWVSGEPFSFDKWASGEPNNDGGTEDKLILLKANDSWGFYDVPNDVSPYYTSDKMGFVIEYED